MATTAATITASISPVPTSPAAGPSAVTISTAALAVSLASFLLAGLTLFKGLFETAEGYKRCGEPSIGPWSRMTWRRWRWYELRFETHFIAPKILISRRLPDGLAVRGDGVSSLRHAKPSESRTHPFIWRPTNRSSRALAFSQCKAVLEETLSLENGADARLDLESQHHRSPNTFPTENKVSWLLLVRALYDLANHYSEQMQSVPTENGVTKETAQTEPPAAGEMASDGVLPAVRAKNLPSTHVSGTEAATSHLNPGFASAGAPSTSNPPPQPSTTPAPTTAVPLVGTASGVGLPGNSSSVEPGTVPNLSLAATTAQTFSTHTSSEAKPPAATPTGNKSAQASSTQALPPKAASNDTSIAPDRLQTEFAISFLEWTWDIMPKDAIRPMAKTTLGELIILGFRLGMEWRVDLSTDSFVAHGQGYGLVCTPQGDMGLVATFTRDVWHGRERAYPELIPDRATDKLVCGIIPVSKELAGDDIYCTTDGGHVDVFQAIMERIKLSSSGAQRAQLARGNPSHLAGTQMDSILSDQYKTALAMIGNQAAALLCEFLPLPEVSSAQLHYFPGLASSMGAPTISAFGSPRVWSRSLAMIRREFFHVFNFHDTCSDQTMSLVTSAVDDLLKVATDIGSITSNEAKQDEDLRIRSMSVCQRVFNAISNWFREVLLSPTYGEWMDYNCLVAAHCSMGIGYITQEASAKGPPSSPSFVERVSNEESFMIGLHYAYYCDFYEWRFNNKSHFGTYITGKSQHNDLSSHSFKEYMAMAWILMFLKGLAWSMSTRGMAMGEPVPSSCFDHPRNVWML